MRGFEGRSSVRVWAYRVAWSAAMRVAAERRALLREGDDRRAIALQAGITAGIGLAATGTLAWLWHREVGDGKLHF